MLAELEAQALAELLPLSTESEVRAWNSKYFGDSGLVKAALKGIGQVPKDQRAAYGQEANRVKLALETAGEAALARAEEATLLASLGEPPLDVTLPGRAVTRGAPAPGDADRARD